MTWWFVTLAILLGLFVYRAMWREDFDGMRTEAQITNRKLLTVDDFYQQYYADSGIPLTVVSRILDITAEQFGIPQGYIRPEDNFLQTDLGDTIFYVVELSEEFGLSKARQDTCAEIDGTFDNTVRYIARQLEIYSRPCYPKRSPNK
jgi:acyl carrier protein